MTDDDRLIEVQGTAEHGASRAAQMNQMVDLGGGGHPAAVRAPARRHRRPRRRVSRAAAGAPPIAGKQREFRRLLRLPAAFRAPAAARDRRSTCRSRTTPTPRTRPPRRRLLPRIGTARRSPTTRASRSPRSTGDPASAARSGDRRGRSGLRSCVEAVGDHRIDARGWSAPSLLAVPDAGRWRAASRELFSGVVDGSDRDRRRGNGGFGYDPIFLLPGGQTTAELPEMRRTASAIAAGRSPPPCRASRAPGRSPGTVDR